MEYDLKGSFSSLHASSWRMVMDVILELDPRVLASWNPVRRERRKESTFINTVIRLAILIIKHKCPGLGYEITYQALHVHRPCFVQSRQHSC